MNLRIAAELHKLRELAGRLRISEVEAPLDLALQRIESQSFALAVVGEFKRGKSTFINALLGQEILPADIAPTSATLNRVTYGTRPRIRIVLRDGIDPAGMPESIGIDQMADYVTKLTPDAEATAAKVKEAIVYFPSRFCLNNVSIIDTPGLSDDAAMTTITLGVLPQVDAAIFVIMPEAPFAGSEGDFLNKHLLADVGRVFFVVTATDRIRRGGDRERILDYVGKRISESVKKFADEHFVEGSAEHDHYMRHASHPKIFGLSGYEALQGKIENNASRLEASGMQPFEAALEQFLTEQRGLLTLQYAVERVASIGRQIDEQIVAQQRTCVQQRETFAAACHAAEIRLADIRLLCAAQKETVEGLGERLAAGLRPELENLATQLTSVADIVIEKASITDLELNKASVGAVGSALGTLADKIPENMQSGAAKGFKRLFGSLPVTWQSAGQQALNKMAEKGQAGVQQYARSEAMEALAHNVATAMVAALQAWSAFAWVPIHANLMQQVLQFEKFVFDSESEISSLTVHLLDDQGTSAEVMTINSTKVGVIPEWKLPELDDVHIDYLQLALKSAALGRVNSASTAVNEVLQDVVNSMAPKEAAPGEQPIKDDDASTVEAVTEPEQHIENAQAANVREADRVDAFRNDYHAAIQSALATELTERGIVERALESLSACAKDVQAGLLDRLAQLTAHIDSSVEQLDRAQRIQMAISIRDDKALEAARLEVHNRLDASSRLVAQLMRS